MAFLGRAPRPHEYAAIKLLLLAKDVLEPHHSPQTILPRTLFISSNENARRVSDGLYRVSQRSTPALMRSRHRGPRDRNDIVAAERPVGIFDSNANLLGHLLEGLGTVYLSP